MALNVAMLRGQIQRVFDDQLESTGEIASRIAQACQAYAQMAQAPPGAPVILKGSEKRAFENALRTLMDGRLQAPQAAQGLGNAIAAFWLVPPVQTGAGGVVTAVIPQAAVGKISSTSVDSANQAAASLANALDLMTKTVFVTNPPPVPPGTLF